MSLSILNLSCLKIPSFEFYQHKGATTMDRVTPIGGNSIDYKDANPSSGGGGSIVPAKLLNDLQSEIINAIRFTGIIPDGDDNSQLAQSIAKRINEVNVSLSEYLDNKLSMFKKEMEDIKNAIEKDLQNQQQTINAIPRIRVGTIIIWPLSSNPADMPYYLECNGQSITKAAYPELYALIGSRVPDLRNRFPQGNGSHVVGTTVNAGLPNITGTFAGGATYKGALQAGAFRTNGDWQRVMATDHRNEEDTRYEFNASWSNGIYGASSTVQPPAYVVRYLIRAKP